IEPCQTYGLTECASQVCTVAPDEVAAHRGQAGRPLSGMEVAIHRADGSRAPIGESGAIAVRGAALFSGYEEDGDLRDRQPSDRWFATGDLGELDRDGFLTVHCRRLDLIISGGENVYPAAVEAVLETHPRIREAGVCGVPDEEWGQLVVAVVVADGAPPENAEMEAWLESRLPGFARPRRWTWAAELPRSPLGKLARDRLAALLARQGPDDAALP
ncbi:MAG: long-chain fatty acid--CoA ligase, partial [Planctomycetes bacterium]|nr:long-chain fatty acid--CoA ligase [Planctomycetota bacterium]